MLLLCNARKAAAASNKVAARAGRARLYGLGNHANARAQPLSVASPHSCQQCRCTAHKRAIPACLHPAVRRGVRRHEGNLADARTQPNNLTPLQNFAQGSAQGQCPGGFNDGEGSTGRRADREEARAEGSKQRGNQMRSDKRI